MIATNKVIEGEFKGKTLSIRKKKACIIVKLPITAPLFGVQKAVFLDNNTVASYRNVDASSEVSFASAMVRGAAGSTVAGNVGGLAGVMTASSIGCNIVLIEFKDGSKSLINVSDFIYEPLKIGCNFNINFNNEKNDSSKFHLHEEIKCPHCKNVALGAVGDRCPFCNRLYSMPAKYWRVRDIICVPLLLIFYPAGLIWMWLNRCYYLKTRIYITIACMIFTFLGLWFDSL